MYLVFEVILLVFRLAYVLLEAAVRWVLPPTCKSVKNEICLITGSGGGIGRVLALEFAKRGAIMILWDINEAGNHETAEMIREAGGRAFPEKCDVSNKDEVYKMAEKAREDVGDVTILVNNAGMVYGKEFTDLRDSEIEKSFGVNALAHFWTIKAFLPQMIEINKGHIVTISSLMGLVGASRMSTYVATKHAIAGLTHSLELDFKRRNLDGIKTTLVCPSHVDTGLFSGVEPRFPSLAPPLTTESCVEGIMHAVLTERTMVILPRYYNLWTVMVSVLPHKALILIDHFAGFSEAMTKFVPNRDYQKEAAAK